MKNQAEKKNSEPKDERTVAAETLLSMCANQIQGGGRLVDWKTFTSNLRLFANHIDKIKESNDSSC